MKMLKSIKKMAGMAVAVCVLAGLSAVEVHAEESTPISTIQDLLDMRENPSGSYVLERDIDMAGQAWTPLDFSGQFDGNGHGILNLEVTEAGSSTALTYDGNMISYDTVFAGFFGKLENAEVRNLCLVNAEVTVETGENCFAGSLAGYSDNSTIVGCSVSGRISLTTGAKMFGVGGIVGFGCGNIEETTADTTLICIDTNVEEKDEQFLGGAYAAGYLNLRDCDVTVYGYDSDHGYVHNGGLVGMYEVYPEGTAYDGYITDNHVQGRITFFEDNKDRRAYCKAYIGEVMTWTYEWSGCTEEFERDERYDYSVNLLPEACAEPVYESLVKESTEEEYGCTVYTCAGCGYSYADDYVLKAGDLRRLEEEAEAAQEAARAAEEEAAREAARAAEEEAAREAVRAAEEEAAREALEAQRRLQLAGRAAVLVLLAGAVAAAGYGFWKLKQK